MQSEWESALSEMGLASAEVLDYLMGEASAESSSPHSVSPEKRRPVPPNVDLRWPEEHSDEFDPESELSWETGFSPVYRNHTIGGWRGAGLKEEFEYKCTNLNDYTTAESTHNGRKLFKSNESGHRDVEMWGTVHNGILDGDDVTIRVKKWSLMPGSWNNRIPETNWTRVFKGKVIEGRLDKGTLWVRSDTTNNESMQHEHRFDFHTVRVKVLNGARHTVVHYHGRRVFANGMVQRGDFKFTYSRLNRNRYPLRDLSSIFLPLNETKFRFFRGHCTILDPKKDDDLFPLLRPLRLFVDIQLEGRLMSEDITIPTCQGRLLFLPSIEKIKGMIQQCRKERKALRKKRRRGSLMERVQLSREDDDLSEDDEGSGYQSSSSDDSDEDDDSNDEDSGDGSSQLKIESSKTDDSDMIAQSLTFPDSMNEEEKKEYEPMTDFLGVQRSSSELIIAPFLKDGWLYSGNFTLCSNCVFRCSGDCQIIDSETGALIFEGECECSALNFSDIFRSKKPSELTDESAFEQVLKPFNPVHLGISGMEVFKALAVTARCGDSESEAAAIVRVHRLKTWLMNHEVMSIKTAAMSYLTSNNYRSQRLCSVMDCEGNSEFVDRYLANTSRATQFNVESFITDHNTGYIGAHPNRRRIQESWSFVHYICHFGNPKLWEVFYTEMSRVRTRLMRQLKSASSKTALTRKLNGLVLAKNLEGNTPLHTLCMSGHTKVFPKLWTEMAKDNDFDAEKILFQTLNDAGFSALELCVWHRNWDLFDRLMDKVAPFQYAQLGSVIAIIARHHEWNRCHRWCSLIEKHAHRSSASAHRYQWGNKSNKHKSTTTMTMMKEYKHREFSLLRNLTLKQYLKKCARDMGLTECKCPSLAESCPVCLLAIIQD